jgi:hypothetical protein
MRKAKWILGLMLVLSNTAFADGGAVCRKIYTQRLQMDCLAGIAERPVNEAGWLVCDKVYGDQPILDCMRVIMGKYISPEGARVCERMVSNKPMTDCLRTLAGHNLQPEAAQVCGKLVSNDPMTSCLAAALDAQYSPDEISSCDQQTYSNQPAIDCMRRLGRRAPPTPPPSYEQAQPQPSSNGGSRLIFQNQTRRTPVTRVQVRPMGGDQWTRNYLRRQLGAGESATLWIPAGRYEVCVESIDGSSTFWQDIVSSPDSGPLNLSRGRDEPTYWRVGVRCP